MYICPGICTYIYTNLIQIRGKGALVSTHGISARFSLIKLRYKGTDFPLYSICFIINMYFLKIRHGKYGT